MKYSFLARLVENDLRTGFKKGKTWEPKGFYYNGKNIILVGNIKTGDTVRISLPIDKVEIKIKEV